MARRPIVKYGDPRLRQTSAQVEQVDEEIQRLIDDMEETMFAAPGVGLAAVQVGVLLRVLVIDPDPGNAAEEKRALAFVNPEIVARDGGMVAYEEGCLSLPGFNDTVRRPRLVTVKALDREGKPFTLEADEIQSRILQHEIDHLDGILFVDRLRPIKRDIARRKLKRMLANGEFD
jgi:peptide deformylase